MTAPPLATPPGVQHPPASRDGRAWHAQRIIDVADALSTGFSGISSREAQARLTRFGRNRLEPPPPPSWLEVFLRQFRSPLIYVLLGAAAVAMALGEFSDAAFIGAVLLVNAVIGFINESKAEHEVRALAQLVRTRARVKRDGHAVEIDGEEVVPGDLVLLESGARVSADVRLTQTHGLRVDESLLTGESVPVTKESDDVLPAATALAERRNMIFAGTVVVSGRGAGLVVATATDTQVGAIATDLASIDAAPPPLVLRMKRFAQVIGWAAIGLAGILVLLGTAVGLPFEEVLLSAIALAVSAVPEGLPIALTVALAVAVSRMARRRVVVRHLPAVEALGSCAVIATDKTGTLTRNELTVERVVAGTDTVMVTGTGYTPVGDLQRDGRIVIAAEHPRMLRLVRAGCLANEASLVRREDHADTWEWSGDPTDVALLALAIKAGCDPGQMAAAHDARASVPFEPERRYAASYHATDGHGLTCVKGAPERVLQMCNLELDERTGDPRALDRVAAQARADDLMREGYRVIAIADAETPEALAEGAAPPEPSDLVLLGLVGMTDPPREGVSDALVCCRAAGIHVVMVTGDHPTTAAAIAERIGMAPRLAPVLHGEELAGMTDEDLQRNIGRYHIISRATPDDKLRIVRAWQAAGAYVAVTGDGVNDAPALRQANIGVAMGRSGTDVAREAAELVLTDDNFASIVSGIEEGRVAYDNVRKVVYLLVSTGAGEVLLVTSALAMGLGVPFTAVQLLWLNLVTNGIQDVALAFEAGQPGVLDRPPRASKERIFNRIMIERTVLAGLVFGLVGLAGWAWWTATGYSVAAARNMVVQLFVLFEILHIGNSRSETVSLFRLSPFKNPVLLVGTMTALGVHLAATHTPFLQRVLGLMPISAMEWVQLVAFASPILLVMELHKWFRRRWPLQGTHRSKEGAP